MRKILFNSRTVGKVLTLLGFSSSAFLFAACYGALPEKYTEEAYTDSIRAAFNEGDTLSAETPVIEVTDSIQ